MSNTPNLGIYYPTLADGPNGPVQMHALADSVETVVRYAAGVALQSGVFSDFDLKVTQRAAGANMTVDISAGRAIAKNTYLMAGISNTNVAVSAAHGTLPRIDRVLMTDTGSVHVLAGTPTASATLDNMLGAETNFSAATDLLLADLLIPAASTSVINSRIRDRRSWAKGANVIITRNANAAAGSDYTRNASTLALVDGTNLAPRIECSGAPIEVKLVCSLVGSASGSVLLAPQVDNLGVSGMGNVGDDMAVSIKAMQHVLAVATPAAELLTFVWEFTPSPGSHIIAPAWATSGAITATMRASTNRPMQWTVREIVRQNSPNNTSTSG